MKVFYSTNYYADIGDQHVFPIRKFEVVKNRLLDDRTISAEDILEPEPASPEDLKLVHTTDYLERLQSGDLSRHEIRRLGLPWSPALVRRTFLAVGGTLAAADHALTNGIGSNLAGGTHHAFPDRGEGFCVLNDVAVAIRALNRDGRILRPAVVDLDVHQGNGTAAIFACDPSVFTFSIHGEKNYPLFKERSTLDIALPDRTTDETYLDTLAKALPVVLSHNPDIIFYLAGADPFKGDKLGRLDLSIAGLMDRDTLVLLAACSHDIPIVTVMSGGYAEDINDTVEIHCNTIRAARRVFDFSP